mgnify:CR=1 FL=1
MVDQILLELPKSLFSILCGTSLHTWSDLSWYALFNGFYLDDATDITTFNICCYSTQFLDIQSVHHVAFGPNRAMEK